MNVRGDFGRILLLADLESLEHLIHLSTEGVKATPDCLSSKIYYKGAFMSNKTDKPKQTAPQLITQMKNNGITFKYISDEKAAEYLTDKNNYLRTAAYRKNYQKYNNGPNKGQYINLDFSYLQELSTIDMHFRFLISKMCLDIEHDLKVRMLKDIENDTSTDGYDIVNIFLNQNNYIVSKLEATSVSPFTCDLIHKYFSVRQVYNSRKRKKENRITAYDDCPAWVLLEMLTFGDFIKFYEFYYSSRSYGKLSSPVINLVRSLRNGAAHNNCILADLAHGTSRAPGEISRAIAQIPSINKNQRQKKLSCRPMLEFVALLYTYNLVVSDKVKYHRSLELKNLFFNRIPQKKGFFLKNELIKSNYEFACKVIKALF